MNLANTLDIEADYNVAFLVNTLTDNLVRHNKEYAEAYKGYEQERKSKLEALTAAIGTGKDSKIMTAYNSFASMKTPVDATEMYNEYINILLHSASETVKLKTSDANAIINDKWTWAAAAKMVNSTYFQR